MKKINLIPGKKYKGYAVLNEYGEISFTPSQIGSKPDLKKIIVEGEDYTIYETKNYILTTIKIPRSLPFMKRVSALMKKVDDLIQDFRKYDF